MTTKETFNIKRFLLLLRYELLIHRREKLIGAAGIVGMLSFFLLLSNITGILTGLHVNSFGFYLLLYACLGSSASFQHLHNKGKACFYLTQPASTEEKFLSRLLLTTLVPLAGICLVYFLFSHAASAISLWCNGTPLPVFTPLDALSKPLILTCLIFHATFFAGGIAFKSHPLLKTFATLFLCLTGLAAFIWVLGWHFIYAPVLEGNASTIQIDTGTLSQGLHIGTYLQWIFLYGLAPVLWGVTYIKLKKYEA